MHSAQATLMNACSLDKHGDDEIKFERMESVEQNEAVNKKRKRNTDTLDGYGERQKKTTEIVKVKHTCTLSEFINGTGTCFESTKHKGFLQTAADFFEHRELAHWQADQVRNFNCVHIHTNT
jgi:hypothetical protein